MFLLILQPFQEMQFLFFMCSLKSSRKGKKLTILYFFIWIWIMIYNFAINRNVYWHDPPTNTLLLIILITSLTKFKSGKSTQFLISRRKYLKVKGIVKWEIFFSLHNPFKYILTL